jgi:hypothetical protein
MTYLVNVEGAFVAAPGPAADGVPRARRGAYRLTAWLAPAAATAAARPLMADVARDGRRPAGPIAAAVSLEPAAG